MTILYEDNHLIFIQKPYNMPSQADDSRDPDVVNMVREYLIKTYHKPGNAYVGLVSRLDRPCGGVMVLAKTSKAARRLTQSFALHQDVNKYYLCIVDRPDLPAGEYWEDYLFKNHRTNKVSVVSSSTSGAKKACLGFCRLASNDHHSLALVSLYTGRWHQIRVQFSSHGYPLSNDQRYNPRAKKGHQLALWSECLSLIHPVSKNRITVSLNPDAIDPWNEFSAAIQQLKFNQDGSVSFQNRLIIFPDHRSISSSTGQ